MYYNKGVCSYYFAPKQPEAFVLKLGSLLLALSIFYKFTNFPVNFHLTVK